MKISLSLQPFEPGKDYPYLEVKTGEEYLSAVKMCCRSPVYFSFESSDDSFHILREALEAMEEKEATPCAT